MGRSDENTVMSFERFMDMCGRRGVVERWNAHRFVVTWCRHCGFFNDQSPGRIFLKPSNLEYGECFLSPNFRAFSLRITELFFTFFF